MTDSLVARGGIEPPTRGFSVHKAGEKDLIFNKLMGRPLLLLRHFAGQCLMDSRKTHAGPIGSESPPGAIQGILRVDAAAAFFVRCGCGFPPILHSHDGLQVVIIQRA